MKLSVTFQICIGGHLHGFRQLPDTDVSDVDWYDLNSRVIHLLLPQWRILKRIYFWIAAPWFSDVPQLQPYLPQ
jgi:hypothetical protein